MEDIISKLAEIETAASHIMDDVAQQKKALAAQYDSAVQEFDRSIEEDIEKRLLRYDGNWKFKWKKSWRPRRLIQNRFCRGWKQIITNAIQSWRRKFITGY